MVRVFVGVLTSSAGSALGLASCRKGVEALTGVTGRTGIAGIIAEGARFSPAREAGLEGGCDNACSLSAPGAVGAWKPGGIVGVARRGSLRPCAD